MTAHHPAERSAARAESASHKAQRPVTSTPRSPSEVLALQRTLGNRAVSRLLHDHDGADGYDPSAQRSAVEEVLSRSGSPLPAPVQAKMEAKIGNGANFSGVRMHTGPAAERATDAVGARALTSGNHVVIGKGGADEPTLLHELTHVDQQSKGKVSGTDNGAGLSMSHPNDPEERKATANESLAHAPVPAMDKEAAGEADRSAPAPVQRAGRAVQRFSSHAARVGRQATTIHRTEGGLFAVQEGRASVWVSEAAHGISPALRRTNAESVELFGDRVRYREYQVARSILDDCLHLAEEIMHNAVGRLQDGVASHSEVQTGQNRHERFGEDDDGNRHAARHYFGQPNRRASPRVGQSYVTVAMNPGNTEMSQYHAAAVVGRDGNDTVTLETFAGSGATTPTAKVYTIGGDQSFHEYWTGEGSYYLTNYPNVTMKTIVARRRQPRRGLARRGTPLPENPNVR